MVDRINMLVAGEPKEFAWRVGISLSAVYNYLGGRTPTIAIIIKIARAYGEDLNWFFREFQSEIAQVTASPADDFVERRLTLVRRPKVAATA
ncbi:MAG: helix-turn-helix domain-containing protein [Patescibacteria group bacterium]